MAVLKDGDWQVFFHYGQPPIKSHLQAEVLNFSAFYRDIDVTHDPGTVGYGSPLHKNYYLHGLNHNVPLINGEGQEQPPKGRKPDPFSKTRAGDLLEFSSEPPQVAAAHPVYRRGAKATRSLTIDGNKLVDVATIETSNTEPQKLGISLHVQGHAQLPQNFESDSNFSEGRPATFRYWTDVRAAKFLDQAALDVMYGDQIVTVTIATSFESGTALRLIRHRTVVKGFTSRPRAGKPRSPQRSSHSHVDDLRAMRLFTAPVASKK